MTSHDVAAVRREAVYRVIEALEIVELTSAVLHRAAQPMPAPLGTLDSIHLATADMWRESRGGEMLFATHDRALALAARATGFRVAGALGVAGTCPQESGVRLLPRESFR